MKNIPKRIYLQVDPDNENSDDFNVPSGVTWLCPTDGGMAM